MKKKISIIIVMYSQVYRYTRSNARFSIALFFSTVHFALQSVFGANISRWCFQAHGGRNGHVDWCRIETSVWNHWITDKGTVQI